MSFKHLLIPAFSLEDDDAALSAAAALASRFGADASALIVEIPSGSEFAPEDASLSEVLSQLVRDEHEARKLILARLGNAEVRFKATCLSVHAAITDRKALPHAQLAAEAAEAAGVDLAKPIINSCGSGVTACHNLLALEHAGLGLGRLYAGGWSEYGAEPRRRAELG